MKSGRSLQEIAVELERQQTQKRDFVAPTTELNMIADTTVDRKSTHYLNVNGYGSFPVTDTAHEQIGSRIGIPKTYYDRMRNEAPALLSINVNHWFNGEKENRMVRTLDGRARAFLSNKFRPLDNLDLAQTVLPVLAEMRVHVESSELTERRLYVKAVTEKLSVEIKKGDVVQAGIVISNSEIGLGSVKVEPMVYRLVCLNGMIATDAGMRKYHVGRSGSEGDMASEFFRDETRKADDKAFWMKVRDVVRGSFSKDIFERIAHAMIESTARTIDADPVKVVEVVRRTFTPATETEGSGILQHLIKGGDLTQYGLVNAVTRFSQDVKDYDRATELERSGGDILGLDDGAWNRLLKQAA